MTYAHRVDVGTLIIALISILSNTGTWLSTPATAPEIIQSYSKFSLHMSHYPKGPLEETTREVHTLYWGFPYVWEFEDEPLR